MEQKTDRKPRENYHHGNLRGALIAATQALIEEKGIDHFSVSDACRRAGVSTAAPYKHFKNKDEMVHAAMLVSVQRHREDLVRVLAAHPKGSIARIVALGQNYIEFALREPGMFRLRFAQIQVEPTLDVHDCGEDIYAMVTEEVRATLGESQINDRVLERAYTLWSFVHGMSYLEMVPDFSSKRPEGSRDRILWDVAERVLRDPGPEGAT